MEPLRSSLGACNSDHDATDPLEPTATDVPVTGEVRLLTNSIWYDITTAGESGWVNGSYVGLFGTTDDDAVKGYRLGIDAVRDAADQPFVLHSVERSCVCRRGIDSAGLCV